MILLAALLNVPPLPPPPPERVEAAAAILRQAPMPEPVVARARDTAVYGTAFTIVQATPDRGRYARQETVRAYLTLHLRDSRTFAAALNGCVVNAYAYAYDVPTLDGIAAVVTTPGGRALWQAALIEPLRQCAQETLTLDLQLTGLGNALRWYVRTQPDATLPRYDPKTETMATLAQRLKTFCGKSAEGALVERGGRLLVREPTDRRHDPNICLIEGARLAGYDLRILGRDGGEIIPIIAT